MASSVKRQRLRVAKLILQSPDGQTRIWEIRDSDIDNQEYILKPRNPRKRKILKIQNRLGEELSICWYEGNDYLNVFVDAGPHKARYMITAEQILELRRKINKVWKEIKKWHGKRLKDRLKHGRVG